MKLLISNALLCLILIISTSETRAQAGLPVPYKYYGNSFSNKFHRPGCIFAAAISKHHLVLFQFRKQAIAAHFTPCRYCLPPNWLSVQGKILSLDSHTNTIPKSISEQCRAPAKQ